MPVRMSTTAFPMAAVACSKRRACTGDSPKNGQEMNVPARRIPVFRAGKGLKNALNPE